MIRTALLTVIAATLIVIAARLEYNAHHQAPQFDAGNCMAHLSEMDAATRAECVQMHTAWTPHSNNPNDIAHEDPLAAFANGMQREMQHRRPAVNPEDERLDARGIK